MSRFGFEVLSSAEVHGPLLGQDKVIEGTGQYSALQVRAEHVGLGGGMR